MAEPTNESAGVRWRKSSRSGDNGGNCVEVAAPVPVPPCRAGIRASVGVRDSKDPTGPVLRFSPTAWTRFLHHTPGRR
ncbi:DUF397 domain-containing protein [Plantactinospora sp. B24E8]|uniref:DUF397 domain-containing protein n=1 Tax=Plantactinospora sp. B24E8 TaxID=3153567 RepID=UPI00325F3413